MDDRLAADSLYRTGPTAALTARLVTPWWYHPALGTASALLIASFATGIGTVVGAAGLLYVLSLYVLPRAYRRATGVWVDGPAGDRARRVARRLGLSTAVGLLLGIVLSTGPLWPLTLVCAVAVLALTQVLGRRFDDALRDELRDDPDAPFRIERD